jgi:DNA processing protein
MKPAEKLSPNDEAYPPIIRSLFGGLLPPDIWYRGNLELFKQKGVGFCGSREPTEGGLQVAGDCAKQLSEHGITVISGYAPGVDMASHEAALANRGRTIIVLPEGMDHFRIKKSIKSVWDWDRVLVFSYFPPNAIWRADRAMDRNKVIVGLSNAVIVLEARERGGTLNAGYCALQMQKPLFVVTYEDMNGGREGNQLLLNQGGTPLRRSRSSGHAQIKSVLEVLEAA